MAVIHDYQDTIIQLRTLTGMDPGSTVEVFGYLNKGDLGGGLYYFDAESNEPANMGTVIPPNDTWHDHVHAAGRWLLKHTGVVTALQFGAPGIEEMEPLTLYDLVGDVFVDEEEVRYIYADVPGGVFANLRYDSAFANCDTMDWAALQMAVHWCSQNGIRLEVPKGVYGCTRPIWIGDDSTVYDDERNDQDPRGRGFSMIGQTSNSRQQADGGTANIRLIRSMANRYAFTSQPAIPPADIDLLILLDGVGYTTTLAYSATLAELVTAISEAEDGESNPVSEKYTVEADDDMPDRPTSIRTPCTFGSSQTRGPLKLSPAMLSLSMTSSTTCRTGIFTVLLTVEF